MACVSCFTAVLFRELSQFSGQIICRAALCSLRSDKPDLCLSRVMGMNHLQQLKPSFASLLNPIVAYYALD